MKRLSLLNLILFSAPAWAQNPVTIHIADPQNAPVAAAAVEARLSSGGKLVSKAGETDAKGDVTLDLPFLPSEKAPVSVLVVAKGFAFTRIDLIGAQGQLQFEKGAVWRGKVLDETGKPVVGAKVVVQSGLIGAGPAMANLTRSKFAETFSATTATDGSFEIADVSGNVLFYQVIAGGYVSLRGNSSTTSEIAELRLVTGAMIRGRLLGVNGEPLGKIRVFTQGGNSGAGSGEAVTAEDGTFRIDTVMPGTYNLLFDVPDTAEYLVPALEGATAVKGGNSALLEFRALPSVLLTGIVRDAANEKPLAGAIVALQGPHRPATSPAITVSPMTGADGRFALRSLPGSNQIFVRRVPDGYLDQPAPKTIKVGTTAPRSLILELTKAVPLHGLIVDEAGKPVSASVKVDFRTSIESDKDGKWQLAHSLLGNFRNSIPLSDGEGEDGYTEVLSPPKIDLGSTGEITIRVRKKGWLVLPGRAVKLDGTPLEGVEINATYYSGTNSQRTNGQMVHAQRKAISNANGDFTIPRVRAVADTQMFTLSGSKAGYVLRRGGEISKNGPIWKVSGLVFAPLSRRISGTTAPGARVVVDGREVVADENGKFSFEGLPEGDSPVFAAKGDLFGGGPVQEPLSIELKKQELQGVDKGLAREVWTEVVRDAAGKNDYLVSRGQAHLMEGEDPEAQLAKVGGKDDFPILSLLQVWGWKGDVAVLSKALGLLKNPEYRVYAAQMCAYSTGDEGLARLAVAEAKAYLEKPNREGFGYEMSFYAVVPLVSKLEGEQAGFLALDKAVAYTLKNHGARSHTGAGGNTMSRDEVFALQTRALAKGSAALVERLISYIEAEPNAGFHTQAYRDAIPELARTFGYEAALPLIAQLEKLPETINEERADRVTPPKPSKALALSTAVTHVLAQMEKAPVEALRLAQLVQVRPYRALALALAARQQTGEAAVKLWTEAVTTAEPHEMSCFAAWAWEADPALGEKLFAVARQRIDGGQGDNSPYSHYWGNFAFYYARVNPAQARFIIEREWGKAQQVQAQPGQTSEKLPGTLAVAMSAIDGQRAWEMARLVPPGSDNESLDARRKIGLYLAMSREKRSTLMFASWRDVSALPTDMD